jgi:IS5 family transposase
LETVDTLFDWSEVRTLLATAYTNFGRPGIDPVLGFKALLLQKMYQLSFPELEDQLGDRDSFRRFVGLPRGAAAPDFSTLHKFRDRLQLHKLLDRLFAQLESNLRAGGLVLKQGTLIDASFIESSRHPPESGAETPLSPETLGPRSQLDRGAETAKKNNRSHYGYKCHVGVDRGSGLIRRQTLTGARPHDVNFIGQLLCGDETAVFADRGYDAKEWHDWCRERGIVDGIMRQDRTKKERAEHPRTDENNGHERKRKAVERVFAALKRVRSTACSLTLERCIADFTLWCIGYNLKRSFVLIKG